MQTGSTGSELLTDNFGRSHTYLRISLTDRCNLRCTYCMPSDKMDFAPPSHLMQHEEIVSIASMFVQHGVTKIRLTGGEPLVRKDFAEILHSLAGLGVELALTTNGIRLHEFQEDLERAGVQSVNISLDTLHPVRFREITRRDQFEIVLRNILRMIDAGFNVKINMVPVRGVNDDEVATFVKFSGEHKADVRFIEFMPFSGNGWDREKVVPYTELLEKVKTEFSITALENDEHSTARSFKVTGGSGSFGFINSVSSPFCSGCNRLRITADGKMKNCLFSGGEADLLGALRSGHALEPLVQESVKSKFAGKGGQSFRAEMQNRPMVAIGG